MSSVFPGSSVTMTMMITSLLMLIVLKTTTGLRPSSLLTCPFNPRWFRCPTTSSSTLSSSPPLVSSSRSSVQCVSPNQLCDGVNDCFDSNFDEDDDLCSKMSCDSEKEVRCRQSHVCIRLPHRHICNGRHPVCPDGSDQQFCLHKIFTGCFVLSDRHLGPRIADCSECFCHLKEPNTRKEERVSGSRAWIFRSVANTHSGTHVTGNVCLGRHSHRICNGVSDCVNGEDESNCQAHRRAKHLRPVQQPEKEANNEESHNNEDNYEEKNKSNRSIRVNIKEDDDHVLDVGLSTLVSHSPLWLRELMSTKHVKLITLLLLIVVTVICLQLCCCCWSRSRAKDRDSVPILQLEGDLVSLDTASELSGLRTVATRLSSTSSFSTRGSPRASTSVINCQWTWNGATLVRCLGSGVHGRVHLARESSGQLVAVKSERRGRGLVNEIDVLMRLQHENIVRLMGCDADRTLVVMEFCPWGDLKTFIRRNMANRPTTIEAHHEQRVLRRRSTSSETLPVSDYLATLQTKFISDAQGSVSQTLDRRPTECPSFHVVDARRLLGWSRQLSEALAFLESEHVVHGDVALRNVLLTHGDVVRLTDFSMAKDLDSLASSEDTSMELPWTHLAPECLESPREFSTKSDVWALGVTLWELFSLADEPYGSLNSLDAIQKHLDDGHRLRPSKLAPRTVVSALKLIFNESPELRPNASSIRHMLLNDQSRTANLNNGYNTFDDDHHNTSSSATVNNVCYWNGYKIIGSDAHLRHS